MLIAVPLFDGVTALDAVGPYEILARLPGATVVLVATEPGVKRNERGSLGLVADRRRRSTGRTAAVMAARH